jgi:aminopeptidase
MSETTRVLASEPFQGRAPGTPGEQKTIAYLIDRFKEAGLSPAGDDGGWTQRVPLVHTRLGAGSMAIDLRGASLPLAQKQQIYVNTVRPVDRVSIDKAPLVFVGYGVNAPERQWDDFKGVDLHGKVAVFLVNDPDFEAKPGEPSAGRFGGKAMTYYGRWTYKYEEAARRGAIAALIVHDTPGAGYGWSTVVAPGGENYDIVRTGPAQPILLQGWLEDDAARDLSSARVSISTSSASKRAARHSSRLRLLARPSPLTCRSHRSRCRASTCLARSPAPSARMRR